MNPQSDASRGLTREHKKKIWRLISPEMWVDIAKENSGVGSSYSVYSATCAKGLCPHPDHHESNPSFTINLEHGYANCFGCGFKTDDPVYLYSVITQKTLVDSLQDLQTRFKISFLPKGLSNQLEHQRLHDAMKLAMFSVCHDELIDAIANECTGEYAYAKDAVEWLLNLRQIDVDVLPVLPIGVMPTTARISEKLTNKYLARIATKQSATPEEIATQGLDKIEDYANLAIEYLAELNRGNNDPIGSIVFPLASSTTTISRFKLRKPKEGHHWYLLEDPYETYVGIFGLNWEQYSTCWKTDEKQSVLLVEGEMDCLSMMAYMAKNGTIPMPVCSISGKSTTVGIEDRFLCAGIDKLYLIGDAPDKKSSNGNNAGGESVVRKWLTDLDKVHSYVFTDEAWASLAPANDPDNAFHNGAVDPQLAFDTFFNTADNYVPAGNWVYDIAYRQMSSINATDYRRLMEVATEYGSILRNKLDREVFVDQVVLDFPKLKADPLKQSLNANLQTEDGFIERCKNALMDMVFIIGTERGQSQRMLVAINSKTQGIHKIKIDQPTSIAQELSPIAGAPTLFIRDHVGFPSFLPDPGEEEGNGMLKEVSDKVRFYLNEAVLGMTKGAPDLKETKLLGQGYHYIVKEDKLVGEYIVEGGDVFKINRDNTRTDYSKLAGPRDGSFIFDTGYMRNGIVDDHWYPGGFTVDKLRSGNDVDIHKLFDDTEEFYTQLFFFKNHHIVPRMLAAQAMYYVINNIFPRQNSLFLAGETSSGKSSFASTISPINSTSDMRILYAAHGYTRFTEAGVRRAVDGTRLVTVLDEAESDSESGRAEAVKATLELFRGNLMGNSSTLKAGSGAGGTYTTDVFAPLVMCAINGVEKAQDFNRLLFIETQKVVGRDSPLNIVRKNFPPGYAVDIAKRLAVGIYPHATAIRARNDLIETQYSEFKNFLPAKMEYRYASGLFCILAVLDYLGKNWQEFLMDFVGAHKENIERAAIVSESTTYLSSMMHNPVIEIPSNEHGISRRVASIAQLLGNPALRQHINLSACGIFFEESTNLLLVLLDQAIVRLLPSMYTQSGKLKSPQLRQHLMRNNLALSEEEVVRSKIISRSHNVLGQGVRPHDVVVLRASDWVDFTAEPGSTVPLQETTEPRKECYIPTAKKGVIEHVANAPTVTSITPVTTNEEGQIVTEKGESEEW